MMTRFYLFALLFLLVGSLLDAQRLPQNPDSDKCYVRIATPDVYESESRDYLTYTREEARQYAHVLREVEISPETGQWKTIRTEDCKSTDPDDCNVLYYLTTPAVYDTIYEPVLDSFGSPYYKEITRTSLVERGALTGYDEIECELMSYQSLPNYSFDWEEFVSADGERVIRETILRTFEDIEGVRVELLYRFGGEAPEAQAETMKNYLIKKGVNSNNLIFSHLPDNRYHEGTFEVFWKVVNVEY